jgi:hypothetical protein
LCPSWCKVNVWCREQAFRYEEMWNIQTPTILKLSQQKFHQMWMNISSELDASDVPLIGGDDETMIILVYKDGSLQSSMKVIAGVYAIKRMSIETYAAVNILHAKVSKNASWSYS